jgi:hypothetical protein
MPYYAKRESTFWVEVAIRRIGGSIETRKYREEGLVSAAA